MSQVLKSCMLRAAGAGVVLASLAIASVPAVAGEPVAQSAPSADQITVVKDKRTGKLRNATAQEHKELMDAAAEHSPRVAPGRALQKWHASGASGIRMTDELMSTAVAVRNADGSIGMQCHESHEHGEHAAPAAVQPVTE